MATDRHGNPITQEMIDGMDRFDRNAMPMKLKRQLTTCIEFDIDETYEKTHQEDARAYALILPSQIYDLLYVPTVGDVITCTQQYAGEILGKDVLKDFRVSKVTQEIAQDVTRFCLYITVYVEPIEVVLPELATSFLIEDKHAEL
jgi:hypothetical protein